jgi:glutamyl-tRNA reductase
MIGLLGISYQSSPISIRQRFSLNSEQIEEFNKLLKENKEFHGLVVLSTCNRSEFYFNMKDCCEKSAFSFMLKSLKEYCEINENIREYFYFKSENDTYKHLFEVVSGINSMVFGEAQIVGQVKQALQTSEELGTVDSELQRLFTKSLEANKKIRTKTKLNEGAFSVSYAAVEKCFGLFPDLKERSVLLVGAGETGTLTLKSLIKKGCENIIITKRTEERAVDLANKYNVNSKPYEELKLQIQASDIIIVSTASQDVIINQEMVSSVMQKRGERKQLYIDLSVPRNVGPEVANVENVTVFDVDDLKEVVNLHQENRKLLVDDVEVIINEYIEEYTNWLSSKNLCSVISLIKTNFGSINKNELEGFKRINKAGENQLLDDYSTHITDKYTRLLIKNLKEVTNNGKKLEYVKVLNELFELN